MTDRYRGYPPAGSGRAATFNPARSSMPASIGYSSTYAGDMQVVPSATPTHYVTTPRGYTTSTTSSGVPMTTRTYAVTPDNRQRQGTRDSSRTRRSTLDSASRPPVIITTTQNDRPHASSSHSSNTRSGSPIRDEYRSSDGQFYAQPASSIRSRSSARPYHVASGSEDYGRSRDRSDSLLSPREVDAYRSSRPSVVYPSDPRHSTAAVDYGDDGYQYTNAGELARYDLDQSKPSRPRRHDSVDRGYYRPNVNYNADQRSFNVNTSHDLSRNYNMNTSRPYEGGRGGPPPSTRGFDKINRSYEAPRDVPPAAPIPPSPTTLLQLEFPGGASERREAGRRSRPLSLHQDGAPRSSHHDDYYRSHEDERNLRDLREKERDAERLYEPSRFKDESVAARGFGIRTDLLDGSGDRRRESRLEEPKKRSDEELARASDVEREERRRSRQAIPEERRDRRESRREDDEDDKERSRIRDKMAAGLGVAATAVGLVPSVKEGDKKDSDAREPKRHRSPDEDRERRKEPELADRPLVPEKEREPERQRERARDDSREAVEAIKRHRRDSEAKLAEEAVASSSDSDDTRRVSRRHRPSNVFNPNDASDLKAIKEQLAAMEVSDKGKERERECLAIEGKPRSRSPSPAKEQRSVDSSRDQSRGRELVVPAADGKQVRVVSPPKDKSDEKPLKGILKQPRVRFPEEANPIREGVAPHKEDKKLKEAPAGARWTKINRKIVNPEALTVGKERFEVRDDFVIVLRVLSKEEIQAYAAATQVLRERRRNKGDEDRDRDRERGREKDGDRENDRDQDGDGGRRHNRHHHRHREDDEEEVDDKDRDRNRERRRRHRRDDEDEYGSRPKDLEQHHHRSYRERERAAEV
ncbi:hypothetical protein TOPH_05450 [Tolypocladium ophioglossoides CBS 100239]|uniref:DUF8035 domain-containing protein n=1 Tax=Tolypocladium ophioglossoides (strain CBS 100239) TaxID=1163406 RepID=A0A0L0N733_TOLOC|nr:hypothetical protein TOPH_05450 [Tolypocladium ophioglossoides CBS 100239]